MQINEIIKYEVNGEIFDTEEDASSYLHEILFEKELNCILDRFCYRNMDQCDVLEGIITHKDEIFNLLLKNQGV